MFFIGPETPRLPKGLAAGVNARPTIHRKWAPGKETSAAKAKFPVSPAVCLALQGGRFRPPGNLAINGRQRKKGMCPQALR